MRPNAWMIRFWLTGALVTMMSDSASAQQAADAPVISIPLEHGCVRVSDIAERVADRLAVDDVLPLAKLDWNIDVASFAGRWKVEAIERLTGGALDLGIQSDRLDVRINHERAMDWLGLAGEKAQRWMAAVGKVDPQRDMSQFGLTFITADDARAPASALTEANRQRIVVLVHGLDDPGTLWADFVPALHAAGFTVGRFDYPDDGPISESADLFADELRSLRQAGVERIDVIAHSMGGLVVRDVLTRSSYYRGDGSGQLAGGKFPAIDRFIMCGTPNHGSQLARLRGVIELRQHLLKAWTTGTSLRELASVDGDGEAGIDLLPNSEFLRRLNDRPLPTHTRMTIVAGRLSPVEGSRMQWIVSKARRLAGSDHAPQWLRDGAGSRIAGLVEREADQAVDALGDGCVSIESATLKCVDDMEIVNASHLGLIIRLSGEGVPPAIAIALERLAREQEQAKP